MLTGFHLPVDVQNAPVLANVECPPSRILSFPIRDSVSGRCFEAWVAQDGEIKIERLGKLLVHFDAVTAGGVISNVEFPNGLAVLTERNALLRSPRCERFRVPGNHDGAFTDMVGQLVSLAVCSIKFESGGLVSRFQLCKCGCCAQEGNNCGKDRGRPS